MAFRIIFMGTPEFAAGCLEKLFRSGIEIAAVVTVPDKPAGRGQKLNESAVKQFAVLHQLPVLQPEKLKNPEFLEQLKNYRADLFVVVAFRMLPQEVFAMPAKGTINLHASLLPQYRGAAPINWAVINGEKKSGITTFFIGKEIDTGNIIEQKEVQIADEDNAGNLHDNLMREGAELLLHTVELIRDDKAKAIAQDELIKDPNRLKPAPKIFKDDCRINWNDTTENIHNKIRGLSPYPAAFTEWKKGNDEPVAVKIYKTKKESGNGKPGSIQTDGKTHLTVFTNNGALSILEIQQSGKKKMTIDEFLRGVKTEFLTHFGH